MKSLPHFSANTPSSLISRCFSFWILTMTLGTGLLAQHDEHEHHEDAEDGTVLLGDRDRDDFGIRISTAGPGTIREALRFPGEVCMNENTMGHVSPRFDGIVTKIHYRLGDKVQEGDILAEMESNETLRPFNLVAPLDGIIVDDHITPGESLTAGQMVYTLADTRTVWVDLRVYQRDLPKVHPGLKVRLTAGNGYPEYSGVISYLGPVVDERTRTGQIRTIINNPQNLLRPGLFVTGEVVLDEHEFPIVIPRSAVHRLDDKDVVFIQSDKGDRYAPRTIATGSGDSEFVEIVEGLEPGEIYVSEGGFFLKADSQKAHFGNGHAH